MSISFSVLMSLYYKENHVHLDNCFQSLWVQQNLKPNQILLVIDGPIGSNLQECIERWKLLIGDNLVTITLSKNIGLGRALNVGLEHCTNEWVFRMDTDDICTPDRFEKQIDFIKNNPDIALFGGQILEFESNAQDFKVLKKVPANHKEIMIYSRNRCPFNHMTVAYKKSVIKVLGGYKHHLFMEDYNLWLRVIAAGYQVANLEDVILYARVGNGMHARRKGIDYIKSEKQLLNLKKELKLQNPFYANMLFVIRSFFRLIPSSLLGKIYNTFLREKVKK